MSISLKKLNFDLIDSLLEFLWKQWCQLGVPGSFSGEPENRLVDLEALLAFTTQVARHDVRLFSEVMNWARNNSRWINVQRLSTIFGKDGVGDLAVAGALAECMASADQRVKWQRLAERSVSFAKQPPEMLFHAQQTSSIGTAPEYRDEVFFRYGLIKSDDQSSMHSANVPMESPSTSMIKSRAIFGISVRADVILYILIHGHGHARQIASFLGYNHMGVQDVLHDLSLAGAFYCQSNGRTKKYFMPDNVWWTTIMGKTNKPDWPDWRSFYKGMSRIYRAIQSVDETRADDYIIASTMVEALEEAQSDLIRAGIHGLSQNTRGMTQTSQMESTVKIVRAFMRLA